MLFKKSGKYKESSHPTDLVIKAEAGVKNSFCFLCSGYSIDVG